MFPEHALSSRFVHSLLVKTVLYDMVTFHSKPADFDVVLLDAVDVDTVQVSVIPRRLGDYGRRSLRPLLVATLLSDREL